MTDATEHGYSVEVPEGYDEAVIRTRIAMKSEGFSILTEMHVGGMIPDTGDARQYLIMGVYNSAVTSRAIDDDLRVAVHLPCNFVVYETDSSAVVAALDPSELTDEGQTPLGLIDEARRALSNALDRIGAAA
jgi:uncharacterized protein (DUF302 family)